MSESIERLDAETEHALITTGDLKRLTEAQKSAYYRWRCHQLGLDPATQPFDTMTDRGGKEKLYANKGCTDQLSRNCRLNVSFVNREQTAELYVVTARATEPSGRYTEDVGAVGIRGLGGDNLGNAIMKAHCVPLDAEILTRDGFRRYFEVREGDEVLAYDAEADLCRWTPLLSVTVHESLPMGRLATPGGQFETFCTPGHTWACCLRQPYRADRRGDGSRGARGPYASRGAARGLVPVEHLAPSHRIITAAPEPDGGDLPITPEEAAVLGWVVTDGTIKRRGSHVRLGICQSKPEIIPIIGALVETVAPGCKELVSPARPRTFPCNGLTYDCLPQHWWYLPAAFSRELLSRAGYGDREDLPAIVTRLPRPARRAMLQAMMLGDGDKRRNFCQTDRRILEAFQLLCTLEGIALGRERPNPWGNVRQRMMRTRQIAAQNLTWQLGDAEPAWCPTTTYGTWVMRLAGRVLITGNTKARRRAILALLGLGMLDELEVETIPRVDPATGEVLEGAASPAALPQPRTEEEAKAHARRSFFAVAKSAGLDTSDAAAMRRVCGVALEREVQFKRDLDTAEWGLATDWVHCHSVEECRRAAEPPSPTPNAQRPTPDPPTDNGEEEDGERESDETQRELRLGAVRSEATVQAMESQERYSGLVR